MKTKQLYLEDSYLQTMNAAILEVYPEGAEKWKVVLSETAFYPMGGGQPTDQGILYGKGWKGKVYQVLIKDGSIFHYIESQEVPPLGAEVRGEIDWPRRYLNMRKHSAGHLIDFALYQMGLSPRRLTPIKADHGKKPMIWYEGFINDDLREEVEKQANLLVLENLSFTTKLVPYEELKEKALYIQPNLPTNKPLRLLSLEKVGSVADGGTQVRKSQEVGPIQLLPIETKEGMTIIRYSISNE